MARRAGSRMAVLGIRLISAPRIQHSPPSIGGWARRVGPFRVGWLDRGYPGGRGKPRTLPPVRESASYPWISPPSRSPPYRYPPRPRPPHGRRPTPMNNAPRRRRGRADQRARALLRPMVAAGLAVCWRCGKPIPADAREEDWDAGHLDDLARGGDPDDERRAAEHSSCNRSAGARLGNQLRSRRSRRLRPEFFL